MTTPEGTREEVHELLEGLHASYGDFDIFNETATVDADRYEERRTTLGEGGVGQVTVWAGHADRGLLLVRPSRGADVWTTPATCTRADESLDDAAVRCVRDGTDLDCSLAGVHRVERAELRNGADPDAPSLHDVTVHFDAVVDDVGPAPGSDLAAASLHAALPEAVDRAVRSRFGDRDPRAVLGLLEPA